MKCCASIEHRQLVRLTDACCIEQSPAPFVETQPTFMVDDIVALAAQVMALFPDRTTGQKTLSQSDASLVFPIIYLGRWTSDVGNMASNLTTSFRFCCCSG
jgi:hypothetical protein